MSGAFQPDDARKIERAWHRNTCVLDEFVTSTFQYAIRLATLRHIRTSQGEWLDISSELDAFRTALVHRMCELAHEPWHYPETEAWRGVGTITWQGKWDSGALREAAPNVSTQLMQAIEQLLERHPELSRREIEQTLSKKKLVIALGGGGGTGFVHLCLFQWLEELGIQPALMTGTSIGALLGYIRALQVHYDAARTTLKLPGLLSLARNVMPCFGAGTHGLMGMCRVDFSELLLNIARSFGYSTAPGFHELRIPFACVASGILRKGDIDKKIELDSRNPVRALFRLTQLTWHKTMSHAAHIANILSSNQSVRPITFGFDELTRTMTASDGIHFSMLVPGVFNYELPYNHYKSREILEEIFKKEKLYRLTDGGLASNVPVRTAESEVLSGRIDTENIYTLGMDVFAPQKSDGIFYPLQQIANVNALEDAAHADVFFRVKYLLSPMNMSPTLKQLHWLNQQFRYTFDSEMNIISRALKPLLPLEAIDNAMNDNI